MILKVIAVILPLLALASTEPICEPGDSTTLFPDYDNKEQFYQCVKGRPYLLKCGSGTWFSYEDKKCVDPNDWKPPPSPLPIPSTTPTPTEPQDSTTVSNVETTTGYSSTSNDVTTSVVTTTGYSSTSNDVTTSVVTTTEYSSTSNDVTTSEATTTESASTTTPKYDGPPTPEPTNRPRPPTPPPTAPTLPTTPDPNPQPTKPPVPPTAKPTFKPTTPPVVTGSPITDEPTAVPGSSTVESTNTDKPPSTTVENEV